MLIESIRAISVVRYDSVPKIQVRPGLQQTRKMNPFEVLMPTATTRRLTAAVKIRAAMKTLVTPSGEKNSAARS